MTLRLCVDCLSEYKRSPAGRRARSACLSGDRSAAWGKKLWPAHVYHAGRGKTCLTHHAQDLADTAVRRAREIEAMPSWADRGAIKAVYDECIRMTRETGIPHEVDHIVPLRGRNVCGLHVHNNLRPIPALENRAKSNNFAG